MESKIKVFIVEDEALIAHEIRRTLEGLGYEVCGVCYDFASAAAGILTTDADLFMLDVNLGGRPDENGIALGALIRSATPRPFIFLTAYSDKGTIAQAAALHPANYLIKPVNPAALFAAIQLAIARVQEPPEEKAAGGSLDFFFVKMGTRKAKLYWQDVYAMEASKNYVRIFINGQAGDYPVRGTLSFVLEQLVPAQLRDNFFRLGRSICLNKKLVTQANDAFIICGGRRFENAGRIPHTQLELL